MKRINNGEAEIKLVMVCGVGKSTISKIINNCGDIINFVMVLERGQGLERKSMKKTFRR